MKKSKFLIIVGSILIGIGIRGIVKDVIKASTDDAVDNQVWTNGAVLGPLVSAKAGPPNAVSSSNVDFYVKANYETISPNYDHGKNYESTTNEYHNSGGVILTVVFGWKTGEVRWSTNGTDWSTNK